MKCSKKRSKNHQADKRQIKVRFIENPLVLAWVSVTLIPTTVVTTTTTILPTMSNPLRATTPWPSTFPASVNLFVTRSWPMPPKREDNPVQVPGRKAENNGTGPPARDIITSYLMPSIMENSATTSNSTTVSNSVSASIMVATDTASQVISAKDVCLSFLLKYVDTKCFVFCISTFTESVLIWQLFLY